MNHILSHGDLLLGNELIENDLEEKIRRFAKHARFQLLAADPLYERTRFVKSFHRQYSSIGGLFECSRRNDNTWVFAQYANASGFNQMVESLADSSRRESPSCRNAREFDCV